MSVPFGLDSLSGFAAETAGATSLFIATHLGIPVSTTHTNFLTSFF